MNEYSKYASLDIHKSTITVAIAPAGRAKPVSYGMIQNTPEAVARMASKVCNGGI